MKNIKLIGTLTTVTPVSVSIPDTNGMPKNSFGQPYIPATSIRGWLRSSAYHGVIELLNRHDIKLSVDEHYMLSKGVDTAKVVTTTSGTEKVAKNNSVRQNNPVFSLYGRWGLAGVLSVGNAFSKTENVLVTVGAGVRNHPFNRDESLIDFVKLDEKDYLTDILSADSQTSADTSDYKKQIATLKRELKAADSDRKKEIFAEIESAEKSIREVKDARVGASETIQRPIEGFEAIDANVELSHTFILKDPSDDEFQAFLWSLYKASVDLSIGGHANVGCGLVNFNWDVYSSSFENPTPTIIGNISLTQENGFVLNGIDFDPKAFEDRIVSGDINVRQFV
ncbi:RAMP superfamily CRISPR-associated protein [Acinetobacter sp. P1(2025)]|uniref:RAMP superfamily CRISPR-associated protein n=1 Tax=Acinetobacter sp. P1(2025) TaxID=3446120 RepID=UPI003F530FCB